MHMYMTNDVSDVYNQRIENTDFFVNSSIVLDKLKE